MRKQTYYVRNLIFIPVTEKKISTYKAQQCESIIYKFQSF